MNAPVQHQTLETAAGMAAPERIAGNAKAKAKRKPPTIPEAATSNAALAAAIEAIRIRKAEEMRLWAQHAALENEELVLRVELGTTRPNPMDGRPAFYAPESNREYDQLKRRMDRTELRAQAERARVERAAKAMLRIDVTTPADALLKLQTYAAAVDARAVDRLIFDGDYPDAMGAAARDLKALSATPPSTTNDDADAELIAIGERYRALAYEAGWIDGWTSHPWPPHVKARSEELHREQQRLIDRSRELRAQTWVGLRTKALLAADRQPSSDFDEYTNLDWMLARSLIADVLQAPTIDMDVHDHDAWHTALGLWPEDEAGERLAEAFRSAVPQPDDAASTRDDDDLAQYDARAVLDEYRSLGGDFTYHPACGERRAMFGTMFPDTPSARSDEIEAEIAVDKRKAKLIARELQIEARTRAAQQDIEEELSARTLESGVAA